MNKSYKFLLLAGLAATLAGCGGGSSSGGDTPNPPSDNQIQVKITNTSSSGLLASTPTKEIVTLTPPSGTKINVSTTSDQSSFSKNLYVTKGVSYIVTASPANCNPSIDNQSVKAKDIVTVNYNCSGSVKPNPPAPIVIPGEVASYSFSKINVTPQGMVFTVKAAEGKKIKSVKFLYSKSSMVIKPDSSTKGKLSPGQAVHDGEGNIITWWYTFTADKASNTITLSGISSNGSLSYSHKPVDLNTQIWGLPQDVLVTYEGETNSHLATFDYKGASTTLVNSFKTPSSDKGIIGEYYADWTIYGAHKNFTPASLPYNHINTLYYGFFGINITNGEAQTLDEWADFGAMGKWGTKPIDIPQVFYPGLERRISETASVAANKSRNPKKELNYILSFGGWGTVYHWDQGVKSDSPHTNSGDFSALFYYHPDLIQKTAASMVSAMVRAGANGVDVDYEWTGPVTTTNAGTLGSNTPLCDQDVLHKRNNCVAVSDTSNAKDRKIFAKQMEGYGQLLDDLRADLNIMSQQTGETYKLTIAQPAGVEDGIKVLTTHKLWGKIFKDVDNINLMSYDYYFNVMAPGPAKAAASFNDIKSSLDALKVVTGYKDKKVLLGIPAYGHLSVMAGDTTMAAADKQGVGDGFGQYTGDTWSQNDKGVSTDKVAAGNKIAQGVRGSGTFDYKCIQVGDCAVQSDDVKIQGFPFKNSECGKKDSSVKSGGTPYCQNNNLYLSYDNAVSTQNKMKTFVKGYSLGGAFIWEADGDITPEGSTNFKNSIIYNIYAGLDNK